MQLLAIVAQILCRHGFHLFTFAVVLQPVLGQEVEEVEVKQGMDPPVAPCSCDCCLVAERGPNEVATLADGTELTRKCVAPPVEFDTQTCGTSCHPSESELVMTSVHENMDMQRFCMFLCRPATKTVGTVCNRMAAKDIASSFNMDGNGNADTKAFMPLVNEEEAWGAGPSNAALESAHNANAANEKKADDLSTNKEKVSYDIRKVISARMRAEAAGNIARAAAAESSTKANREKTSHQRNKVDRVLTALQESAGAAGTSTVEAAQLAADAAVDATDARAALTQARALAKNIAKQTEALAKAEIKKAVKEAAIAEGDADAFRYGWDKPPNWGKVVAQTMAEPYLKAMVGATWRASEYEGYAKGILGQAKAAQAKAKAIHYQANQYAAVGDGMKAKMMDEEVKGLISKSHNLEAQAEGEWKRADNIQRSVAEWQQGALLAAGHAGWAWSNYFTPPPPVDKLPYHLRNKVRLSDWTDPAKRF